MPLASRRLVSALAFMALLFTGRCRRRSLHRPADDLPHGSGSSAALPRRSGCVARSAHPDLSLPRPALVRLDEERHLRLPQRGEQGGDARYTKCGVNVRVGRLHLEPHRSGLPSGAIRWFAEACSYFFTPETATHFGGVPASIWPEGQGSVGFAAVEGGAPCVLGADGADGTV